MANPKLNVEQTKRDLEAFDFPRLFIEDLGWSNPSLRTPVPFDGETKGQAVPIAAIGGVVVLEVTLPEIPNAKARRQIHAKLRPKVAEHVIVFVDTERTRSCWSWTKHENKREHLRDHYYFKGQPGDGFISKIANLAVDLGELDEDGRLGLLDAAKKVRDALDVQRVVKKFYTNYQNVKNDFVLAIEGIDDEHARGWYASVLLNRLMFIYFLQKGMFLDGGNIHYLEGKLSAAKGDYYARFLNALFFEAFAKKPEDRSAEAKRLCGAIPYLNGGLFIPHRLEEQYTIAVPDEAFGKVFKLFGEFSWTFNDVPGNPDDEINPDVLGYIFEKYINQKEFGAYYTPTEITEYLCQQTIERLVLDKMSLQGYEGYESIADLLFRLDARGTLHLLREVLPSITLLDPACGSGAFLFAALRSMLNLYSAAMGRITAFNNPDLNAWRAREFADHRSEHYWLKKKIIVDNLYGVDIMPEATEIAKLRLFMALVSSAKPGQELEPLPNIDFNILPGNSLIGLMRVEDEAFDKHLNATASLFGAAHNYKDLVTEKNRLTTRYRHPKAEDDIPDLRDQIDALDAKAKPILDEMILDAFKAQGVKFEQATWDAAKAKEGKPTKRDVKIGDVQALDPFHWGYGFFEVIQHRGGFDAIITNPPWEVLQSDEKEFIQHRFDSSVQKNKIRIEDWKEQHAQYMEDREIRDAWLDYLSRFPFQSTYFKTAPEYKCLRVKVKERSVATKINLYYLFTERCFRLMREGGLCGIVIPSGIYTDLGAKGLREMLFEDATITGLFGFENRRQIFENVDSRFKFILLSFRKGGETVEFPAVFMRHEVSDVRDFPRSLGLPLSVELIKRLSPDSWSLMEFKSDLDIQIAEQMLKFPLLGERIEGTWNVKWKQEFNMTTDSGLFHTTPGPERLPLFEGKMIHQFTSAFSAGRYFVAELPGRKALLGRERDDGRIVSYQKYRVAYRAIGRNTDERTMIATIIPKHSFFGHSIYAADDCGSDAAKLFIVSLLDSLSMDYALRQTVTANVTPSFVYQLPMPRLSTLNEGFVPLVVRAARLICTTSEFADLWNEVMADGAMWSALQAATPANDHPVTRTWTPTCGATQPAHRARLRAELDGLIAHLYGLTEDEFAHILTTFPLVPAEVKTAALDEYRKLAAAAPVPDASTPLSELIERGEGNEIEFKQSYEFVDPHDEKILAVPEPQRATKLAEVRKAVVHSALKTICGFINAKGGYLLLGVRNDKSIAGLRPDLAMAGKNQDIDEFELKIRNAVRSRMNLVPSDALEFTFEDFPEGPVCCIRVHPDPHTEHYLDDRLYVREGNQTVEKTGPALADWIKRRHTPTPKPDCTHPRKVIGEGLAAIYHVSPHRLEARPVSSTDPEFTETFFAPYPYRIAGLRRHHVEEAKSGRQVLAMRMLEPRPADAEGWVMTYQFERLAASDPSDEDCYEG